MTTGAPKNRDELKALAAAKGRRMATVVALDSTNDPWVAEQDFRSSKARWITELFGRLKIRLGVHLRGVFYTLVSQETPVVQVDGEPFVNTVDCFGILGQSIRDARYLGLIAADAIIDRRNPEPVINFEDEGDVAAGISQFDGFINRRPFGLDYSAPTLTRPWVTLSQEPRIGQRYLIEIWVEKSTANDVLLPLGEEYGINIVTFVGEVSATACKSLVDRAIESRRPVRILYLSDFDPAGRSMPVAAAAKIDFFATRSGSDLDIRVEPVALTREQCIEYHLPRTPIKQTEKRAAGFEARYGEGATELDALQAIHPGALRQILVEHIERYYDHDLDDEVEAAIAQYREQLDDAEDEVRANHEEELDEIDERRAAINVRFAEVRDAAQAAYDAVVDPAREVFNAVVAEANAARTAAIEEVRPEIEEMEEQLVEEAEALFETMHDELVATAPDPDDFEWPEPAEGDEDDDALFDSTRDYFDQVDIFRAYQGKTDDVGFAVERSVTKECAFCKQPFTAKELRGAPKIFCTPVCAGKARNARVRAQRAAGVT